MKTKSKPAAGPPDLPREATDNSSVENAWLRMVASVVKPFLIDEKENDDEYLANVGNAPLQHIDVDPYFDHRMPLNPEIIFPDEVGPLFILADAAFHRLAFLARSSPSAADGMLRLLIEFVAHFEKVSRERPDLLRPLTRKGGYIPVLAWPDSDSKKEIEGILKFLEVGAEGPYRNMRAKRNGESGRPGCGSGTGINVLARRLFDYISHYRNFFGGHSEAFLSDQPEKYAWLKSAVNLPEFGPISYKNWHKVAWEILMDRTDGHPERHETLRAIGKYRERHSENDKQQTKATPGTIEPNIKDGISTKLKNAFQRLARDLFQKPEIEEMVSEAKPPV